MRFSIIVPVFNTVSYLTGCVRSVIEQSFDDWELILVDDGSSDGSGDSVDEFALTDKRIKAFHQANSGAFRARRTGIAHASGEYIVFLDDDDRLEQDCLLSLSRVIAEKSPDILMYVGKVYRNGADTGKRFGKLGESAGYIDPGSLRDSLISSHDMNSLCNKAFRTELFYGDDSDYSCLPARTVGEDKIQLLHPVGMASSIYYMPDELYIYNSRDDSTIHSIDLDTAERFLNNEMFSYLRRFMQYNGMTEPHYMETVCVYYLKNFVAVYYRLRKYCRAHGKMKEFRSYEWKTLDREAFRYSLSRLLSAKEKIKLSAARLHL